MASLAQSQRFELSRDQKTAMKADFSAHCADERVVAAAICTTKASSGYLLDPHTACGFGMEQRETRGTEVILATASPAKFPDAMEAITGERPQLPPRLSHLMTATELFDVLPNDLAAVQAYVAARSHSQKTGPA